MKLSLARQFCSKRGSLSAFPKSGAPKPVLRFCEKFPIPAKEASVSFALPHCQEEARKFLYHFCALSLPYRCKVAGGGACLFLSINHFCSTLQPPRLPAFPDLKKPHGSSYLMTSSPWASSRRVGKPGEKQATECLRSVHLLILFSRVQLYGKVCSSSAG